MQLKLGQQNLKPFGLKCPRHPDELSLSPATWEAIRLANMQLLLATDMILKTTGIQHPGLQAANMLATWQAHLHQCCIVSQEELSCAVRATHAAVSLVTCFVLECCVPI